MILSGGIALTSCSDFLDAKDKSNIPSDSYFNTEEGFENLAATPYYKLRDIYGDDPAVFCSGTDLYEQGRSGYTDKPVCFLKKVPKDEAFGKLSSQAIC